MNCYMVPLTVNLFNDGSCRGLNRTPSQSYTGCHLPYEITQCYLPPDTSEHIPPFVVAVVKLS